MNNLNDSFIEERLSLYLMLLKITPNLKGHAFFKECAKKILDDPTLKFNIHDKLFKNIADMFDETIYMVARSLRHAIEVSLKREGIRDFERYTKVELFNPKPSPRELLCILVERVMVENSHMTANLGDTADLWNDCLIFWKNLAKTLDLFFQVFYNEPIKEHGVLL